MKNIIAYLRVSTKEQAEHNLSLDGQLESIKRYCERERLNLVKVFTDAGASAKTVERPALQKALEYCQTNYKDIDGFVVYRVDRFARNVQDHMMMRGMLKKYGVALMSVNEPLGDTAVARLYEAMSASFAQFDNDVRSERTSEGMKRRVEEGSWPYPAPLGYVNVRDDQNRPTLAPSEIAPLISTLFREFIKGGLNVIDLSKEAKERGLVTKKGNQLTHQTLSHMLRNPVYAGYSYRNLKKNGSPELVEGLHSGLISKDEYYAIQDILEGKKRPYMVANDDDWPLRGGFVKCSECTTPLTSSTPMGRSKRYSLYSCPKCKKREVGHTISIDRDKLHEEFEAVLKNITPSEAHLSVFKEVFLTKWQNVHIQAMKEQKKLEAGIMSLKERKTKVVSFYIDGKISDDEKDAQMSLLERDLVNMQSQLAKVTNDSVDAEAVVDASIRMMKNIDKFWRSADLKHQLRFQHVLFPEG